MTTAFNHCGLGELACKQFFSAHIRVGHQDGEIDRIHEAAQNFGAIVKFMVAHRHRVIAKLVHHLSREFTLVIGVKQRALELIAAIHEDRIVCACAGLCNGSHQSRGAAETLAFRVVFRATSAVIFANRLKARMEIVGV